MKYPKIYLAMDNSFATKRWTRPEEWTKIIKDLGVECIEASADTEADPFYCGEQYLEEWIDQVEEASFVNRVKVVNFFTGYTSYRTIGLAHPDERIRKHIVNDWLSVMARIAARVHAGLGFFIHAFPESVLLELSAYSKAKDSLYTTLAEIAKRAEEAGNVPIILEQMYTPHQIPWTITGTLEYLAEVTRRGGIPVYVALDTGHQTGQHRFLPLSKNELESRIIKGEPAPFLGPEYLYELYENAKNMGEDEITKISQTINEEMQKYPHLFSKSVDCDLYQWLRETGCYSPIIHLQQTNGTSSSHLPFTQAYNKNGIVKPIKMLEAIADSYRRPIAEGMPPRTENIYLTFEIFPHTSDTRREILSTLNESVKYWRQWIYQDGIALDELLYHQGREL